MSRRGCSRIAGLLFLILVGTGCYRCYPFDLQLAPETSLNLGETRITDLDGKVIRFSRAQLEPGFVAGVPAGTSPSTRIHLISSDERISVPTTRIRTLEFRTSTGAVPQRIEVAALLGDTTFRRVKVTRKDGTVEDMEDVTLDESGIRGRMSDGSWGSIPISDIQNLEVCYPDRTNTALLGGGVLAAILAALLLIPGGDDGGGGGGGGYNPPTGP